MAHCSERAGSLVCDLCLFFFTLRVAYIEKKRRSFFLAFVLLCFNYDSFIHFFLFVFFTIVSAEQDWAVTLGFSILCNILHSVGGIFYRNFYW